MEKFQKEFIGIVKAAFTGKAAEVSADFDWERAINTARVHNIAAILYYGAVNSGIGEEETYMQQLQQMTLHSSVLSLRQSYEIEQIEAAFAAENIEYMPLKGTVLKTIYPLPEMRTMGDADILIKLEQYPQIQAIMERLQFTFKNETDHELVWKKPTLFLELHKSIMTTYNKDFYGYFGTGWGLAKPVPGTTKYEMTAEDFYLYAFVHFTKHYRISGIGIKHLLDLWVYAEAKPELDWAYIRQELDKMHLLKFFENIKMTADVWFCDAAQTDVTDLITSVIFNSGQYGSAEQAIINRSLQYGQKTASQMRVNRAIKFVFLPYPAMTRKYAVLKKAPVLLPVMWVVRWFGILSPKRKRMKNYFEQVQEIDAAQIQENKQALDMVGLEFHNE